MQCSRTFTRSPEQIRVHVSPSWQLSRVQRSSALALHAASAKRNAVVSLVFIVSHYRQASAKDRARLPSVPSFAAASLIRVPLANGRRVSRPPFAICSVRSARSGKKPPALRRPSYPAAAVFPALPPIVRQTCTRERSTLARSVPVYCSIQQKQRQFVDLVFLCRVAALAPDVATRSASIRALKFGLSGLVDRNNLGHR